MPVTSPDSIYFSDVTTTMDPNAISSALATSVQAALALRQRFDFVWANAAARTAQTGMANSSTGYQADTKTEYIYESGAWRLKTPHAEFTASASAGNAAVIAVGVFTLDATVSTSAVFVTPGSNGVITINDPGIYGISSVSDFGSAATTTSYTTMYSGSSFSAGPVIQRNGAINGLGQMSLSIPNLRVITANSAYSFDALQQSGATRTMNTRLRITRLG